MIKVFLGNTIIFCSLKLKLLTHSLHAINQSINQISWSGGLRVVAICTYLGSIVYINSEQTTAITALYQKIKKGKPFKNDTRLRIQVMIDSMTSLYLFYLFIHDNYGDLMSSPLWK